MFDDVFGRANVHLWKFDPKSFVGKCVVQDFCSRLGIAFPKDRIVRVNESLSREAVALLFAYRKYGRALGSTAMNGPENQRLVAQLRKIGGSKFRLSAEAVRPILDRNREDIEWMEKRLGPEVSAAHYQSGIGPRGRRAGCGKGIAPAAGGPQATGRQWRYPGSGRAARARVAWGVASATSGLSQLGRCRARQSVDQARWRT